MLLCPWNSPGKNTRADSHSLLQGIFLTQGSNTHVLGLLHCRQIMYWLWLIHVDAWQKPSQYCNYPPIKKKKKKYSVLPMQGVHGQSLVGELGSHVPLAAWSGQKKKKEKFWDEVFVLDYPVGPSGHHECPYKRESKEIRWTHRGEGLWRWSWRLEGSNQPQNAWSLQKLEEVRRAPPPANNLTSDFRTGRE